MTGKSRVRYRLWWLAPGLLLTAIALAMDFIGRGLPESGFGTVQIIVLAAGLLGIVVSVAGLLGVAYGALVARKRHQLTPTTARLSTKRKLVFAMIPLTVFVVLGYSGKCTLWSLRVYGKAKAGRGWEGRVHAAHPQLGVAGVPDSNGVEVFRIGPDIPMRFGALGFRVPLSVEQVDLTQRPLVLTLGCSFTYGAACIAEDTYAEQLAQRIDGTALNAGVCSYGAAGMVLVAETAIPEYKPELVIVQYSPWLGRRSKSIYLPSYYGKLPGPYFAEADDEDLEIQTPVFRSFIFDTRVTSLRGSGKGGLLEFCQFACTDSILWHCYDDFYALYTKLSLATGGTTRPSRDDDQIIAYAYDGIHSACENAGAKMLIVVVGMNGSVSVPESLQTLGVPIVRADLALVNNIAEKTIDAYRKSYAHWRGDPPRCVDVHPNALAHSIIAKSIQERLENLAEDFADASDIVPTFDAGEK